MSKQDKINPKIPFLRRHRNFFVGLFISIPSIIIPCFFLYSFLTSEFMVDWAYLYVTYEDAYDLKKGNSVTYRGQKIGYVSSVDLTEDNVVVQLKIDKNFIDFVKKDSEAHLFQKFFVVGDWWIKITPGTRKAGWIQDGDKIKGVVPFVVNENLSQVTVLVNLMEKMVNQIVEGKGAIGSLFVDDSLFKIGKDLATKFNNYFPEIEMLFNQVKDLLSKSEKMMDDAGNLTKGGKDLLKSMKKLLVNVNYVMKDMTQLINNFNEIPPEMKGLITNYNGVPPEMEKLLNLYNKVPPQMNELVTDFKPVTHDMRSLMKEMETLLKEAELVFKGIQEHWLLRGAVRRAMKKAQENK